MMQMYKVSKNVFRDQNRFTLQITLLTQLSFTCSKSKVETLEKGDENVQT